MAMADDGQLQKLMQDEQMSSNDPQPMTHDEQLQIRIPGEPEPQPNEDPSYRSSCLRSSICGTALCFVIVAGAVALIVWYITRPAIIVYVESASLTSFNLSSPNNLHHNLSVELSFRNPRPSWTGEAYYIQVETSAYYDGKWFQRAPLNDFYMGTWRTTMLRAVMAGTTAVDLGTSGLDLYNKQREAGAFDLEVRLQGMAWYSVWSSKTKSTIWKRRADTCTCLLQGLRLHATDGFVRTKCQISSRILRFRPILFPYGSELAHQKKQMVPSVVS